MANKDKKISERGTRPRDHADELNTYYKKIDDIDTEEVGRRILQVRTRLGMSLDQFGRSVHLSYNSISKMELGKVPPNARTVVLLHSLYGVDPVWLLFGRHTTHMDILNTLSCCNDKVLFDVFVRLYSYFSSDERDKICLVPNCRSAKGVTNFSKWQDGLYRPIESEEIPDDEVEFTSRIPSFSTDSADSDDNDDNDDDDMTWLSKVADGMSTEDGKRLLEIMSNKNNTP